MKNWNRTNPEISFRNGPEHGTTSLNGFFFKENISI